jgi:hypothetical protein
MTYIYKNIKNGKTIYSDKEIDDKDYVLVNKIISGLNVDEVWTKTIQIKTQ